MDTIFLFEIIKISINALTLVFFIVTAIYTFKLYKTHVSEQQAEQNAKTADRVRQRNSEVLSWNQLILGNHKYLEQEVASHPYGSITVEEMEQVYKYFIFINIAYSSFRSHQLRVMDKPDYEAEINNLANLTVHNKDFIRKHVLPRGYAADFRGALNDRWAEIDKNGILPM